MTPQAAQKPAFDNGCVQLFHASARDMSFLADESVDCCVTSPPYWGLRDYGLEPEIWDDGWRGTLGLEPTPQLYVKHLAQIFNEVWRVLKAAGVVFLNLGDSYAGSGGAHTNSNAPGISNSFERAGFDHGRRGTTSTVSEVDRGRATGEHGLKPKDLVGIPWRVAFALQDTGWWLRSDIIWSKPNPLPESVTDRPTKSHEYLFLLTKSERYYYNQDAIREAYEPASLPRALRGLDTNKWSDGAPGSTAHSISQPRSNQRKVWQAAQGGGGSGFEGHSGYVDSNGRLLINPLGRNRRSVWTIPTQPYPEAHFATFPEALVSPCILAGCPQGKLVLDPFSGAGTTCLVAQKLGRRAVGVDLSEAYTRLAIKRLEAMPLPLGMTGG